MFEQRNEIRFFEEEVEETYMDKPKHDSNHPACGTPNPPWWCDQDDSNAASIDMYLLVLVIIAILIRMKNFKYFK